ncbi:MAG TPA: chorismate mutase [bacterium]|nr:chorismate mutase [bacterium]
MNNGINGLREKIDRIDDSIVELLKHRASIASEIIDLKKNSSINVEDVSRENSIIQRLCEKNPEIASLIKEVYGRIFNWVKSR